MKNQGLKLFISYSHSDEHFVEEFLRFTQPLETNGLLAERWYDRNITAGDDFWDNIEEHLNDRDIVCCFISSYYIASKACMHELDRALEIKKAKGILVLPIIISDCGWLDVTKLKKTLAMPKDGKPITDFVNQVKGWMDVYNQLKGAAEKYSVIRDLSFSDSQKEFLEDASLLTKAHGNKNVLRMSDIYIDPDVEERRIGGHSRIMSFDRLMDSFDDGYKVAIVGDDQSGKTTLAKRAISRLKKKNFIPVYIKDEEEFLQGDMMYRISNAFSNQYNTNQKFTDYEIKRIVPIIDDFHKAKNKFAVIKKLSSFQQIIIIVDGIFDIDMLQERAVVEFRKYLIKPLKASLRNDLIRRWVSVSETVISDPEYINSDYQLIDERMKAVDEALGKVLGKGIMPSYPFFILTLLSNYDSINKPLNEEITSQGYCYQALIILFLGKQGVKNENLDSYINYLTEFAHERYEHQAPLSDEAFKVFDKNYNEVYNMTENKDDLMRKLKASGILRKSSLGNYDFNYPYLYYFFAGKYFAEHIDNRQEENKVAIEELKVIMDNLHKNENAYILIFMVHHTKDNWIIGEILQKAGELFKDYEPATMSKEEMMFFKTDDVKKIEIKTNANPNEERKHALQVRDKIEESRQALDAELEEESSSLSLELRRSVKTVEVIGRILSNRAGSLKKTQLLDLFENGMNVHLRLVSSFFVLVQKMMTIPNYDSFIKEKIREFDENLKPEEVDVRAQKIFWNVNFGFIVAMIKKISDSLGSKSNIKISDDICTKDETPIKFLIRQEIAMTYQKNIRVDEIKAAGKLDLPMVAKNALQFSIANFCLFNRISDRDREQLVSLGFNRHTMLPRPQKNQQ